MRRDWSIQELSERSGISVSQISNIERGVCNFSVTMLVALAEAMALGYEYILHGRQEIDGPCERLNQLIGDCSQSELNFLLQSLASLKQILRESARREAPWLRRTQ